MKPRLYKSEGVVLARKNYSEADRIIIVYSKDFGKLTLIAKGVRKPSSRKRGALEVFSRIRFSAAKGKALDIITEAEVIDSYPAVRKNLKKVALLYFFMETIGRTTREGEQNEMVYTALTEYMEELKNAKMLKKLRIQFIYDMLVYLGFWAVGEKMADPEYVLEDVIEGRLSSARVGKKILT